MTNYNESPDDKLTEILRELDRGEYLDKGGVPGAKQAILNWHNKQVKNAVVTAEDNLDQYWNKELDKQIEGVLDRLSNALTGSNDFRVEPSVKLYLSVGQIVSIRSAIEAERNKLKEMLHG